MTTSSGSTGLPQYPHFVELHIWIPLLRQQVAQAAKNHLEEVQFHGLLPFWFACEINHIDPLVMPVFSPLQARWYAGSSHTSSKGKTKFMNVFQEGRTVESVAYDLALTLAAKDPSVTSPDSLLKRISDLLPECREVTKKLYSAEQPPITFNPFK
nr:hypothetical protein [Enterobacter hormaechei]